MLLNDDSDSSTPSGILVLGAPGAGDLVADCLTQAHLARALPRHAQHAMAKENERLVGALGGTAQAPPMLARLDLDSELRALQPEARDVLVAAITATEAGTEPWVWWHPFTAFFAEWWADIAKAPVVLIFAVGPPEPAISALAEAFQISEIDAEHLWFDLHRAALTACDHQHSMIVSTSALDDPKSLASELAQFLDLPEPSPEALRPGGPTGVSREHSINLAPDTTVLWSFLERLSSKDGPQCLATEESLTAALQGFYDEAYYDNYETGVPYRRGIEQWDAFFGAVSERIVSTIRPHTVLDVGCAIGFLVEKLRTLGVDASGFDISDFAVSQAPPELAPYLSVRSITEEIDGHYDLITCLEVVEHLPPHLSDVAIGNMCRHADAVLFSSSPDDFDENSHISIRSIGEWAQRFSDHGFYRDFSFDASFVAPHAVLFRRGILSLNDVVAGYEQRHWMDDRNYREQIKATQEATQEALEGEEAALRAQAEVQHALSELLLRRDAERIAAREVLEEQNRLQTMLAGVVTRREAEIEDWRREVELIHQTKIFRYSRGLRRIYGRLRAPGRVLDQTTPKVESESPEAQGGSYDLWVATYDTLTDQVRNSLMQRVALLDDPPQFSVLVPAYNTAESHLRSAIDSVRRQLYPHWQLCLADDCSTDDRVGAIMAEYAAADERISFVRRPVNGHISEASNSALAMATGSWVVLLDHDDELAEQALAIMALTIADHPEVSYLYSDEDKLDAHGRRFSPFFKPDFDPVMLLGENYPCHLFVARRECVEAVGGFRAGFEGSQDWDLVLRVTENLKRETIRHVPHVLYHWRVHPDSTAASGSAKPYAATAGVRAVEEHLARTGQAGQVTWNSATGRNRVKWDVEKHRPLVSIIIPTRDGRSLIRCLDSVRRQTTYDNYEILVVDNGSRTAPTLDYLQAHESVISVIRDERPFNYSALNNAAAEHANGELLLLLNDDVEVMGGDWLEEMVSQVLRPGVGIVGAKLDYPNGTIQHAGVTLGIYGVAAHVHKGVDRFDLGYFGDLALTRQVAAVTGACMLIRKSVWDDLGGLDEQNLAIAFNDIDFCLRAREAGSVVIWTPFAELIHHESISRGRDDLGPRADEFLREVEYMKRRWAHVLRNDPAYNPNLTLLGEDAGLAWPPRVSYLRGDE